MAKDSNNSDLRKNASKIIATLPTYKSKAVKKAATALPNSPRKHSRVIEQLMYDTDIETHNVKNNNGTPGIDLNLIKL